MDLTTSVGQYDIRYGREEMALVEYRFVSLLGESLSLEIPPATGTDSYFVIAPSKAGSVLLFNLVNDLASAAGRSVVDLPGQAFAQGIVSHDFPLEVWSLFETPGHIFTGLRGDAGFLFSLRAYRASRKILLVRDPRDIAVSLYYSVRYSHTAADSGRAAERLNGLRTASSNLSLEAFLQERWADAIFDNMRQFAAHARRYSNFRVFRYEDIIFNKESFVTALASELQIEVSRKTIIEIANRHDVRPVKERPTEHIRQVTPGNYKAHLNAVACARLEFVFGDVFEAFGYSKSTDSLNSLDKKF
jgi:hypothetical protein